MARAPLTRATQAVVLAVVRRSAPLELVEQGVVLAPYNIPTEEMRATAISAAVPYTKSATVRASQGHIMAVVKGRATVPNLKGWGFTLDGHDFYVLKLGTMGKTLVYDLASKQWAWWASGTEPSWRAATGLNWHTAGAVPQNFGTNVIVGDDSSGALWVLDPSFGLDEVWEGAPGFTFQRVATAQIPVRGRSYVPIYAVTLTASGTPAVEGQTVDMKYSDDQGKEYLLAPEAQDLLLGRFAREFTWSSLGRTHAPGRLIRIEDEGAVARVDSLEVDMGRDREEKEDGEDA